VFAIGQSLTNSAYAGILNGTTPRWTVLALLAVTRVVPPRVQAAGLAVGAVLVLGVVGTGLSYVLNYALLAIFFKRGCNQFQQPTPLDHPAKY
jgi:hypothetical protein